MSINPQSVWEDIQAIKKTLPLVHNITNYVVMESTANSLLAIGASPIMSHAVEEVADIVKASNSLIINIGTLSPFWIQGTQYALKCAEAKNIPVVFDPVGVGVTTYRKQATDSFLNSGKVTVIRGNASEISYLAENTNFSKGVDSLIQSINYQKQAEKLALDKKCVVWMSGKIDVVTNGYSTILVHNGHCLMSKIIGTGCTATAIVGAFLPINSDPLKSCVHAAVTLGISGEIAAKSCQSPGSFKVKLIDALYELSLDKIKKHMKINIL